jgi:hypothetical protein
VEEWELWEHWELCGAFGSDEEGNSPKQQKIEIKKKQPFQDNRKQQFTKDHCTRCKVAVFKKTTAQTAN